MSAKVFKFMGATYRILMDQKDLGNGWEGLCEYGPRTIKVAAGLVPRQRAVVLIHEMTHAVFHQLGWFKRQDEMLVSRVQGILEAVLKDNRDLVLLILDELHNKSNKARE